MDTKLLISSRFPLLLSQSRSSHSIPKINLSLPAITQEKSLFLGKTVAFLSDKSRLLRNKKTHLPVITAVVKRRKELPFDNVIQRDKKLKLVMRIRSILVSQPDRIMSVRELGKFRRYLGLTKKRRFIALLRRFPGVFEILEEGVYSLKFRLTPEAERIYLEELRVKNEMEGLVITKLRKLLMMSLDKRILIEKIAHLKADLGLPPEFKDTICQRYPQYFKVVRTDRGPALELTHWDPALAVSAAELAAEENRIREIEERNLIIDRPPRFNRTKLPKGLSLSKGETRRLTQFNKLPYISPYSDFSNLKPGSPVKERHACGVVHEILSLTLEKRTLVDHLTHFREEFRFSQQLRGMLIRHPDMFYVSLKGDRDSVFLREAYRDAQLVEKSKLLLLKEKMRALVAVPRFPGRRRINGDDTNGEDVNGEEEEEEQSDLDEGEIINFDDVLGSDFDDDDDDDDNDDDGDFDDDDDEWSDGGEQLPPDFDEGKIVNLRGDKLGKSDEGKELLPVFPDGRPRERW